METSAISWKMVFSFKEYSGLETGQTGQMRAMDGLSPTFCTKMRDYATNRQVDNPKSVLSAEAVGEWGMRRYRKS